MNLKEYKPCVIDKKVKEYISAFGAICIHGPKRYGKKWDSPYHNTCLLLL